MGEQRPLNRVERALGTPGLAARLAALPAADLQSLLLAVYRERVASVDAAAVLAEFTRNAFVQPAPDRVGLAEAERLALSLLPAGFEAVELSPLTPLGTVAALTPISQDWVVAAGRNSEVVSDSTAVLALECAVRRRRQRRAQQGASERVSLFASHRVVRAQPFPPPYRQHFRLLALCSAGRDTGGHRFDVETLLEHIGFILGFAHRATPGTAPAVRVALTALSDGVPVSRLEQEVAAPLAQRFPTVSFGFDHDRQGGEPGYYVRACFKVWISSRDGEADLADGGFTRWGELLLSDRKERLLTSGLGLERLVAIAAEGQR